MLQKSNSFGRTPERESRGYDGLCCVAEVFLPGMEITLHMENQMEKMVDNAIKRGFYIGFAVAMIKRQLDSAEFSQSAGSKTRGCSQLTRNYGQHGLHEDNPWNCGGRLNSSNQAVGHQNLQLPEE